MAPTSGVFQALNLNYTTGTRKQATDILDRVAALHAQGHQKVGITYSANHDQSVQIRDAYREGHWQTGTDGGNQARIMAEVEHLLLTDPRYQHLRSVFQILPITTCAQAGGVGAVHDRWLQEDLDHVQQFASSGGAMLGWQNQDTVSNTKSPFAIGGGISSVLTSQQTQKIQSTLLDMQSRYAPSGPGRQFTATAPVSPQ
ncbi:hypothetical protein AQUSIP_06620 [Aquicella siphonis]|uniref:Uncharacterized protein n=1 Tax=Aquicella siphonis TaxID=254247 RepID=A0A5E4PFS2_9COXI|nr:hypothetical protein [Aquicella siphonis]VVC75372.1 hypothetical protein AQUSIP_06620 [Aquicella siphonis]